MAEDWLSRWAEGRIGWHEEAGNAALRAFWPDLAAGCRVLVPLCGKSPDLLWLTKKGCRVTGVELSEIAIRAFFEETGLPFSQNVSGGLEHFHCADPDITLVCGDYFSFRDTGFDALYDRASLVALPPQIRPAYVRHSKGRLNDGAKQLLVTLEYDQSKVGGPPFSVPGTEVNEYWPDLRRAAERDDIANCPPKFRHAGLSEVREVVWVAG